MKKYVMENSTNGAVIECTERYIVRWLARGFTIKEIKQPTPILGT